ncbi:MAG: sigma-54-dependent Fis family transcriptional regulator, partial [Planctomycetes bacterium]|nr:sigma-54-dependent Fis family transcriptional regulator [Planctomycetota bacterium]
MSRGRQAGRLRGARPMLYSSWCPGHGQTSLSVAPPPVWGGSWVPRPNLFGRVRATTSRKQGARPGRCLDGGRTAVDNKGTPSCESPSLRYRKGIVQFGDIWTANHSMKLVIETAAHVAPLDMDIVILGETGTGKNLLAQAVHNASPRRRGPFVEFNTGSVDHALAGNELFGHEVGAFTGAEFRHQGLFEQACGGTLFLDEIGNMPVDLQAKILTAVERKKVRRLGGKEEVDCDLRLICATNADVDQALADGVIRKDLYFRLGRCVLHVPPLRERPEDVPLLVERFIALDDRRYNRSVRGVSPACMAKLLEYPWPGNVRELRAKIGFAVALCSGQELSAAHVFQEPPAEASGEAALS